MPWEIIIVLALIFWIVSMEGGDLRG